MFFFWSCRLTLGEETYRWPLDIDRQLTSSFAEYRPGRFHAGIDVRTNGVGREVYAMGDGFVSRVRCSPYGYGKAVYLQLKDGTTVVYAHLDDYFEELRAYVRSQQHHRQKYDVDIQPEPNLFPVSKGQLIARSGQTGIGAPHLHFEVRDGSQRPINPRLLNLEWPDNVRPIVKAIIVAPDGPHSIVNGDFVPVVVPVSSTGHDSYRTKPVRASGRIGIGVNVNDPGSGGYSLGIHELELSAGSEIVFRMKHDRLSYDNHRNAAVSYHPYLLDKGKFLNVWRWPGNVCDSYSAVPQDSFYTVPDGDSELRLKVTDYFGNLVTVSIPINADPGPQPITRDLAGDSASSQGGTASLEVKGNYLLVNTEFKSAEEHSPLIVVEGPDSIETLDTYRISDSIYRSSFAPVVPGKYHIRLEHPVIDTFEREIGVFVRGRSSSTVKLEGVEISAASGSPYGVLFARVSASTISDSSSSLTLLSPVYTLWPERSPIDTELTLVFPKPNGISNSGGVHVYRRSGSGWSRQSTKDIGRGLQISTRILGAYAIMRDTTAPTVSEISVPGNYKSSTSRPKLQATIADWGSGVASWDILQDNKWLLTSYDPERHHIAWERDEDLIPGERTITFRVTDYAGNTTTETRTVIVP